MLNFGILAKRTNFQPLKINKKRLWQFPWARKVSFGRSSQSHIQVVLSQVMIPMLQLLDTVACYSHPYDWRACMTCQCGMSKLLEWYERGQSCLRQENLWSQKQVKWEPWSQCQKNRTHGHSIWLCALCAPMVCHPYHTWETLKLDIEDGWFPNTANYAFFLAIRAFYPANFPS